MPTRARRPCNHAGCRDLNVPGTSYCERHQADATAWKRETDAARPSARERGYDTRWDKARRTYLAKHPVCAGCVKIGVSTPATVVDHIDPHRGDQKKFWDKANWQPLCASCHGRKTATEDSGFARRRRFGG